VNKGDWNTEEDTSHDKIVGTSEDETPIKQAKEYCSHHNMWGQVGMALWMIYVCQRQGNTGPLAPLKSATYIIVSTVSIHAVSRVV